VTNATIALADVSVFYGEVIGLSGFTLGLDAGITGLVGPNGSGKSTLMRVLTGLVRPREGSVRVLGGDPFESAAVRAQIAFVPATECFFDNVSGRKNLFVAFLARGLAPNAARDKASEALQIADLEKDGDREYGTWSRGMRQRLKLGLALATEAPVVLLDEPFLGVDPPNRHRIRELVGTLGDLGRVVLISSHVLHEIEQLTERVAVLARGRLLGAGQIDELLFALRDQHPHRIAIVTARARELAPRLIALPHVQRLELPSDERVEILTTRPEVAYVELAQAIAASGLPVRMLQTQDNSLESLFAHLTEAGARRL
jgi:ABC-2 type transport system ATP-binding protein